MRICSPTKKFFDVGEVTFRIMNGSLRLLITPENNLYIYYNILYKRMNITYTIYEYMYNKRLLGYFTKVNILYYISYLLLA